MFMHKNNLGHVINWTEPQDNWTEVKLTCVFHFSYYNFDIDEMHECFV